MRMNASLVATITCLLVLNGTVFAQEYVRFELTTDPTQVVSGAEFLGLVEASIDEGWHLYSMTPYPPDTIAPQPTTIVLVESEIFQTTADVRQPAPKVSFDENFGINTEYFTDTAGFQIPIKVNPGVAAGSHPIEVRVRYMACNDRVCLPPQTVALTAAVEIVAGPAGGSLATVTPGTIGSGSTPAEVTIIGADQLPQGMGAYIWFALAMGGLALLTPCVFPMIPITVSYFTKREVSRRRAMGDAALYSAGIVLTFTLLGFLLTAIFGAGGINRVATNPLVNILIAAVFVLFALSLFGVLEIGLPSRWVNLADRKSSSMGGPLGILLMALTFSLTSFTCTVPFVGTVMVTSTQGQWWWALLGVTAFALVFSAPFFLLALFPSWLKSLPKSGNWMNAVKITMGFLELAAALKFISNVDLVYQWELITRPIFITIWLALALMTTAYLLGRFYFPHELRADTVGAGRVLAATLFLAVSFYLLRGLFGFPLGELDAFLPPRDYGATVSFSLFSGSDPTGERGETWLTDYEQALQVAAASKKPVFIDFTGYTCTNCRWMEANIFVRPEVEALFRRFVLVRLYTDGTKPEHRRNLEFEQERFGTIALPLYVIMTSADEPVATFPGLTRDPAEFISFLEKGLAGPAQLATGPSVDRARPQGTVLLPAM